MRKLDERDKKMRSLSSITNRLTGQPMFNALERANKLEHQKDEKFLRFEIGDIDLHPFNHILEATKKAIDGDIQEIAGRN